MDTLDQTPQAEAPVAEPAAVAVETPLQEAEDTNIPLMKTKEEVVARAQELAAAEEVADKQELDLLKQLYYRYHHADAMALRQEFIDNGGDAQQYVPAIDPTE